MVFDSATPGQDRSVATSVEMSDHDSAGTRMFWNRRVTAYVGFNAFYVDLRVPEDEAAAELVEAIEYKRWKRSQKFSPEALTEMIARGLSGSK